jgi:endo-1,4-beta-xylanase
LLKDRGLVDGIGIQCHQFNMDTVSTATMKTNLDSLAATGLPIYVSELDMTGDDATQLARYKEKFPVLWNHSGVAGITLWGYIQGQTWKDNTHLLNTNGTERPALTWLKSFVSGTTNTSVAASSRSSTAVASSRSSNAVASSKSASSTAIPASSKAASSVASGTGGVKCTYVVSNSWNTGFTGLIRVTNSGTTTKSGWNASWQYTGANRITGSWNATVTGSNPYSASNLSWNGTIGAGQSVEFGFQGLSNGGAVETPAVTCK